MSHSRAGRRDVKRRWLQFELMEQRNLMATYVVQANVMGGATGDGSPQNPFSTITQAVDAAKLNPGADEIQVGTGDYAESVTITDTDDLTIRGNASQRPDLNRAIGFIDSNANFVIENLNINSTTGQGVVIFNGFGPNQSPLGPFKRQGSVVLNNMNIQVSANATFWDCVSVRGSNQITANNLVLTNGRIVLNDVNAANLSQITVIASRTNALVAEYVTQLNVTGLIAQQPANTGVFLNNPTRTAGFGPTPVNAPSVVNLSGIQISNSGGTGLVAGVNTTLSVLNSSFNSNAASGVALDSVNVLMDGVEANGNSGNGFSISGSSGVRTTFTGRNVAGNTNRTVGMFAHGSGPISIAGGSFSSNTFNGILADNSGNLSFTDVVASNNIQFGINLINLNGDASLTRVTTNDNTEGGVVTSTTIPSSPAKIDVSGGQSLRNPRFGMGLLNVGSVTIDGFQASDNSGNGLHVSSALGLVSISNSQFNRNFLHPNNFNAGVSLGGLKSGLTLTNVTANDNSSRGIVIDNAIGSIVASGILASGNAIVGLEVRNSSTPQRATLALNDSNLSGNGSYGLMSKNQSKVTVARTHFDNNGPTAAQTIDFAVGASIVESGSGGVSIEDSTAIGTRFGVTSGAAIEIVNAVNGPEVEIRRVTISDTVVHPLTTTNVGVGLVVIGNSSGLRIEDSNFTRNLLLDSIAARSLVYSTVPLTVIRSQFLDNAGVSIDGTQTVSLQDSTIARTNGIGVRTVGGGSIQRSTISGNTAEAVVQTGGQLSIEQSTLTGNATTPRFLAPPFVIQNGGTLTLHDSIIAGNGPDSWAFSNRPLTTSLGFNLLSGTAPGWTGLPSDIIGDINNRIDPLLGPLANNGGPALTHMPQPGSPALETGNPALNGTQDQRGVSRPQNLTGTPGALPDIGAVEAASVGTAPTILLNSDSVTTSEGSILTLRGRTSDYDGNLTSLIASQGSIQLNADGTFQWTLATVDDLSTVVTLTATDALGGVGTIQFRAIANNVAPTLSASYFANPVTRTVNVQAIATDPSTADMFTFTIDWGDGTSETFPNSTRSQLYSHLYTSVWPSSIVVNVSDDDGGNARPIALSINAAPTITLDSNQVSVDEGMQLRMAGRVNDFEGSLASLVASIGAIQLNADGTFLWTLNGVDDFLTTVFLTATDTLGASSLASFTAEVKNVAPALGQVTVTADWTTRIITLRARVTDAGLADTHLFNIQWDDRRTTTVAAAADGTLTTTHQYFANSGPVVIAVQAVDDDRGTSQTVTVAGNVLPSIQLDATSVTGDEGSQLRMTGRATDADGNLFTVIPSIGSVQLNTDGTFVWTLLPSDDLNTTVTLAAQDALGAIMLATFTAVAQNVAPTVTNSTATYNFASRTVALGVRFLDTGFSDSHLFTILWGDGTGSTVAPISVGFPGVSSSYQYTGFLPTVIMVQGTDDDGGSTGWVSVPVNYPPTVQLEQTEVAGIEGSPVTLRGRVSDLNGNLSTLSANLGTVQLNADGTFLWSFTSNDDLSRTVVGLTATDVNGAVGVAEFAVSIVNVAPTLDATTTNVNSATRTVILDTSVIDPGLADTHVVTIQWGDGTTSSIAPGADRKVSTTHQYGFIGGVTIVVRVTDDDGQSSGDSFVINTPPSIQLNASSVSGNEGSQLRLTGRVTDAERNLVSLAATMGSVQLNPDGTFVWTYAGIDDLSPREVGLTATDAFGGFTSTGFLVTVNNVAPTLGATSANLNSATRTVTLTTSVIDVGAADTHLFTIQWGDGTTSTLSPSANKTLTASHQYTQLGPTTISVRATDDDGASSATLSVAQSIPGFVIRSRELFVYGSNLADSVTFGAPNRGQVTAIANFGGTTVQYTFGTSSVDNVIAYLAAGNDVWSGSSLKESQFVYGEAGNDQITTLTEDDLLVGGDGADTLNGGDGRDLLFGGLGADLLYGQDGGDVLVAGRYERENDLVALRMLRIAWIGSGSYQTRVGRLRTGVGTDSLGNIVRLSINQITDDAVDQLFGGKDADWYLTNSSSEVTGATRDESIN